VEWLEVEALSSNPNTAKTKKQVQMVAHACSPNYSGGRQQEDQSMKPARTNGL
jgi:hypothetical protein